MSDHLPCKDLFDKLEEAIKRSEDCWDLADKIQYGTTAAGVVGAITCASIIPTIGGPFGLGGGTTARDKLVAKCLGSSGGFLAGLSRLNDILDDCNAHDLDALQAAKDFEKCAGEHKEFLNSLLRPNS